MYSSGQTRRYQIDASGWWNWLKDEPPPQKHVTVQPQVQPKPRRNEKKFQARDRCWISAARAADWETSCPPKLVSFPVLKQSLKSNQPVQGNLVEIWDPKVFDELKTLRSCFDPRKPLTAVLCGAAKDVEGATFSSFAFTRGEFGQKSNMWL